MKNERGEITIDGFYDNVQPLTALERQVLAHLPIDVDEVKRSLGIQRLDEPQERNYFERLVACPTLTINGIHGGYGGPGSKTVLPQNPRHARLRRPLRQPRRIQPRPNENMEIARFMMGIKTGAAMLTYLGYDKIPER